jgi:hypothetical protein
VHAYLDGRSFEDEAIRGGGGGRFFTGAPRDGYVCSVCHDGGEPLPLRVEGIPAEGWEPGRTYVLTIPFTDGARNVGAAIEVADERGTGVGTFDGLASADTRPEDLCRGPAPGEPGPPAARGLSLEGRTVARADVCGARRLAVRWTAPPAPVTSVRVFASLVAAEQQLIAEVRAASAGGFLQQVPRLESDVHDLPALWRVAGEIFHKPAQRG